MEVGMSYKEAGQKHANKIKPFENRTDMQYVKSPNEDNMTEELLEFFKTLADSTRLKIIGLLATKPYTGEKLAHALGLGVSTISHHVGKLCKAGLVHAHPDGYYNIYSLDLSAITRMAQRLTKTEDLPKLAESVEEDAFDRKVMKTFVDSFGRFKAFPAQEKKYLVLLRHAVKSFEFDRKYTEKEVSDILIEFHDDYSKLRRDLIEYKFMGREGGGKSYWRIE